MGNTSKKPKKIESELVWPVENVDYHIKMVAGYRTAPSGWLQRRRGKADFTSDIITPILVEYRDGLRKGQASAYNYTRFYYLYPGPRPSKKWGPVCP